MNSFDEKIVRFVREFFHIDESNGDSKIDFLTAFVEKIPSWRFVTEQEFNQHIRRFCFQVEQTEDGSYFYFIHNKNGQRLDIAFTKNSYWICDIV